MAVNPKVVFELPIRVLNTEHSSMPQHLLGAAVAVYALVKREIDQHLFVEFVASAVEERGLVFEGQMREASIIEIYHWDNYVEERWGDLQHGLPSAAQLSEMIDSEVYFGPFACFETD